MKSSSSKILLLIIFMFLILIFSHLNAQVYHCQCDDYALFEVDAVSGLTMREAPSSESDAVAVLPVGTEIAGAIEYGNYNPQTIEGKEGGWRKVFFGKKSGYMFDGFLKRIEQPNLLLGYDMYYGFESTNEVPVAVFGQSDDFGQQQFDIKNVGVVADSESGYFELNLDEKEHPLFLISGMKTENKKIVGIAERNTKLLPGSIKTFHIGDTSYQLITDGQLIEVDESESEFSPTYKIENYGVKLVKRVGTELIVQPIFENEEVNIWDGYYEGSIFIEFMGDLDGDGGLDLILTRYYETGGETFFMLSSEAEEGFNVKLIQKLYWGGC